MTDVLSNRPIDFVARRLRTVGVVVPAAMLSGVLVGGVGGRISMRVSGLLTRPELASIPTEGGNRVGDVTLTGSLLLILFGGLFAGMLGGVLYLAMHPWFTGLGRWAGVAFGSYALLVFSTVVIRADNHDFTTFGPAWLNLAMYAAMFPLFGAVTTWLVPRLRRWVPPDPIHPERRLRAVIGWSLILTGVITVGGVVLASIIEAVGQATGSPIEFPVFTGLMVFVFLYLVVVVPAVRAGMRRTGREVPSPVAIGLIGWPLLPGLWYGWQAVGSILG